MAGEGPDRSEVAPVERQDRVGSVPRRKAHIDSVGQVQVKVCILALNRSGRVEHLKADRGKLEAQLPSLSQNELDDHSPGVGPEASLGQVIDLGEHERRDDHRSCFSQDSLAFCRL
jgi:hypothetical protein